MWMKYAAELGADIVVDDMVCRAGGQDSCTGHESEYDALLRK